MELVDEILESIFDRGIRTPHRCHLLEFLEVAASIDEQLIEDVIRCFNLDEFERDDVGQVLYRISMTSGAPHWLAIHEAGHVIVGLHFGIPLTGVRFAGDATTGTSILHDPITNDEQMIRNLIAVDLAGNIAQLSFDGCDPPTGGYLSQIYNQDLREQVKYPSDFIEANHRARLLTSPINLSTSIEVNRRIQQERMVLFQEAEKVASGVVSAQMQFLCRLAEALMHGPMKGSEILLLKACENSC